MSKKQRIRALALCVFRREDKIFVAAGYDNIKRQTYYRPIGGGIEFGEPAHATIIREIREEIHAEVKNVRYLGTLENLFVHNNEPGHEIVLMFDGDFVDEYRNADDYTVQGTDDGDILFTGEWKTLAFFRQGHAPLYPNGLLQLLDAQA
jgi:8-oxo-dGTP pyrophosphatase MutT (NUDIX family)